MGVPQTASQNTDTIGVLELGTNSLKLHLSLDEHDHSEPFRVEWDVGFEVYSTRYISEETIENVLSQSHDLLEKHGVDSSRAIVFGIATGVFRDAENTPTLLERLSKEEQIPVRILTAEEEASLLIEGASKLVLERPGMVFDLGGGHLELVYLGGNGSWLREELPLGAIQLHHLGLLASETWDEKSARQWIDTSFQHARVFKLPSIHGTGGTMKAIAQVAGTLSIPIERIQGIERDVRANGAPSILSKRRRELLLPGIMVVCRLAEHIGARTLHYTRVDLGEILLTRLQPFRGALRGPMSRSFLFHHLDIFRTDPPNPREDRGN